MTFFLSIFLNIKDGLKFAYLGGKIPNERPLLELKSNSTIFLFINIYKNNKVQLMLDFIDKNALAEIV